MSGPIPPLHQYAFMAWCSVKTKGQLYLYLCLTKHRAIKSAGGVLSRGLLKQQGWLLKVAEVGQLALCVTRWLCNEVSSKLTPLIPPTRLHCIQFPRKLNLLVMFSDGRNVATWAAALKSEDFELLCPGGGRAPVDRYEDCHLAQVPPHMVSCLT